MADQTPAHDANPAHQHRPHHDPMRTQATIGVAMATLVAFAAAAAGVL